MRERLGEHRARDDDVGRGGVGPDAAVTPPAREHLLEQFPDLGSQRERLVVEQDRPAVQRQDQIVTRGDRLVQEPGDRVDGRSVGVRGGRAWSSTRP